MEKLKKMAGITATQYVEDGMVVRLGTGSTAYSFVEEIGHRMKEEGLKVVGVTASGQTTAQTESLGIPLKAVDDIDVTDVTADGADEADTNFNGIKGGGGALLMEKIVATPTKEYIWAVDESKMVDKLGASKLPVEAVQYGADRILRKFEKKGYKSSYRMANGERFVTDMKDYIIDPDLGVIENPVKLGKELKAMVGIAEHGLFNGMINKVIAAGKDGVNILEAKQWFQQEEINSYHN